MSEITKLVNGRSVNQPKHSNSMLLARVSQLVKCTAGILGGVEPYTKITGVEPCTKVTGQNSVKLTEPHSNCCHEPQDLNLPVP